MSSVVADPDPDGAKKPGCSQSVDEDDAPTGMRAAAPVLPRDAALVTHRLWRCVLLEFHHDAPQGLGVPVAPELHVEVDEGVGRVHLERGGVVGGLGGDLEDIFGGGLRSTHRARVCVLREEERVGRVCRERGSVDAVARESVSIGVWYSIPAVMMMTRTAGWQDRRHGQRRRA